jgi:predicted esterase
MTEETKIKLESITEDMRLLWSRTKDKLSTQLWLYKIMPCIIPDKDLVVCPDRRKAALQSGWAPVKVEVIAAGGQIVAQAEGTKGETLRFKSDHWAEGAYEVRCTTTAPNGQTLVEYLSWYKGDILAAARLLVAEAAQADLSSSSGLVQAMLAKMVQNRLGKYLHQYEGDDLLARRCVPLVHSPLMEFEELKLEMATSTGLVRPNGFVRLAYRDEADGGPDFCRAYLPREYDPAKNWPMVVSLHGWLPSNPPYVRLWGVNLRHDPNADIYGLIMTHPHGRLSGWCGTVSERDALQRNVLKCIELAKGRFSVDDERVYLVGYSMGGVGVWHIGTRHPELFAAIAPIYGAWDYRVFPKEENLAELTDRERFRLERQSSFVQAEALLHTPVFMNHGDNDEVVSVELSRYSTRMLQRWGYPVRYWEHPGRGHSLFCEEIVMPWLLSHKRESNPRRVRIRAADLQSAATYWVRLEQRQEPFALMLADVEVMGPNKIRLDTENVVGVSLSPRGSLIDITKPLEVIWNGTGRRTIRTVEFEQGRVTLWAKGYSPGRLNKRPGLAGPISDVINTPFAIVEGTISGDAVMRRKCKQAAQLLARHWKQMQHWSPRYFKDTAIAEADIARYSLILIGGPDDNLVVQKLKMKLPLEISRNKVVVDGRTFKAIDAVIQMIYPNPLNADRYVVITAANSVVGMSLAIPHRHPEWDGVGNMPLMEHLPRTGESVQEGDDVDFVIADGRVADEKEGEQENKVRVIASGVFNHEWRIEEAFLETKVP